MQIVPVRIEWNEACVSLRFPCNGGSSPRFTLGFEMGFFST